jgi:hypothetical protein
MEVHHHSHLASGETHTERKKWTHYFWEFFMLFLAVVLGFLVENQREHYIEHQREKKFAALLYEDLKKDTVFINRIIEIKEWRNVKIDSLFYFLSQPDLQKNATAIYYYTQFLDVNLPFKPNDATILQLRSSGSLRYFSNLKLYNEISVYYSDCSFYMDREVEGVNNTMLLSVTPKLFNAEKMYSFLKVTPDIKDAIHYPSEKMKLLTTESKTINELLMYAKKIKTSNDVALMLLKGFISQELTSLLKELKKEYKLK